MSGRARLEEDATYSRPNGSVEMQYSRLRTDRRTRAHVAYTARSAESTSSPRRARQPLREAITAQPDAARARKRHRVPKSAIGQNPNLADGLTATGPSIPPKR